MCRDCTRTCARQWHPATAAAMGLCAMYRYRDALLCLHSTVIFHVHQMLPAAREEPTPGRVANPQFGLTAKGCLACSCPDPPTLPLARTRPRGPGHGGQRWQGKGTRTLDWMYRLAERYLVRTGDCAQHCPSTSRRCSVKSTLPSPSTVTNWQRSVPHPELVLVHSEP